ncbi:hypothetical protein ACH4U3_07660 [Streptomyces griseoruber]|uniref:hypothetical protein n=1 Tax=Streptomyces griseoruber TaxID=1943 RepID=UPI0037B390CE
MEGGTDMRTPQSHADRLRNRVAAGDTGLIADEVLRTLASNRGHWQRGWDKVLDQLRALPADRRAALRRALADRHPARQGENTGNTDDAGSAGSADNADDMDGIDLRCGALVVRTYLSEGLPADPREDACLAADRRAALDGLGRRRAFHPAARFELLAEAELAAGRALSAPVVAAFRRTAREAEYEDAQPLIRLADRLTDPVLDVGEAWADRALRDTAASAAPAAWQALLAHAATATASRPTARWDTRARALLAPLDPGLVRATVLDWLALVGRPRTLLLRRHPHEPDIDATYDPHNATALRGLAWLLSLLPAHPDTARALGRLAETSLVPVPGHGPRGPKVANAAVLALSRLPGDPGRTELDRLAARVTYRSTARLIAAAIAR